MPPKITLLPTLLKRLRFLKKRLSTVQSSGTVYRGVWLEKRTIDGVKKSAVYWCVCSRLGNLPNGRKSLYISPGNLQEWQQTVKRGRKVDDLQRDIRDTQRRIDAMVKRAEKRGIVVLNPLGDPAASPEYYTPPLYIDMARQVLGQIDLDPASNPVAQQWIQAERFYTKEDDGLSKRWTGRLYLNPPYESPETRLLWRNFLERAIREYHTGTVSACVLLLNRSESLWYKEG